MTPKNISELDKNFSLPTKIEREGLVYHNIEELSVHEDVKDVCLADHIHPNDIGFRNISSFVIKALKEFL